ncbi:hypothetical protein OROGR_031260 [Orobanche gracilis]
MLAFAAAASTASISVAATSSLLSAEHPAHTSINCAITSALHPGSVPLSNQLLRAAATCKLTAFRVEAMSEILPTPTLDSKSPVSGKRQALISLSDKRGLPLLGNGLQELGRKS